MTQDVDYSETDFIKTYIACLVLFQMDRYQLNIKLIKIFFFCHDHVGKTI